MATRLDFGGSQLADLKRVCGLGPQKLNAIAKALEELPKPQLRAEQLVGTIRDVLQGNQESAESVGRQALSLNGLMRQTGLDLANISNGLGHAIEELAGEDAEFSEAWNAGRDAFLKIVDCRAVKLTAKAIDLSYDYANLFRRGRILTDVRPLFNHNCDTIEGVVVSYTLRLRYDNIGGDHDISLAMDQRDLEQLKVECERAIMKGKTAKAKMQGNGFEAIVTGEQNDATNH